VGLTGRTAPAHASGQTISSVPTLATVELSPKMQNGAAPAGSASAPSTPASTASSGAAQASPAPPFAQSVDTAQAQPAPNPSGNQIWECTTNGVKTFSNNRCGNTAVLRELGPVNVMDASPASNVHWYGGPDSNGAPDDDYPSPPQPADNSYPVMVGVPYLGRRRPERPQQLTHHDRGHPRRN
jgi:hypothetical protein